MDQCFAFWLQNSTSWSEGNSRLDDAINDSAQTSSTDPSKSFRVNMTSFKWLVPLLLIPLVAIVANYVLFTGVSTPGTDFGTGSMFDQIAPRYDFVNRAMAVNMDIGWRKVMVQRIKERVPESPMLIDVATGTADVALLLADAMPSAQILGVDPSQNMLAHGQDKITEQQKSSKITLQHASVEDLGSILEPSTYNGATMAFGIRNVADRPYGLCQIRRVLKQGGVLGILEFSEPDESFGVMGYLAKLFIRYIAPTAGAFLSGKPKEYLHLQNSIQHFPTPVEFGNMMENLQCPESVTTGAFRLERLQHLNFGSVQLYVATAV